MIQQFIPIVHINIVHEYMGEGQYDGFNVTWSHESSEILDNLQLLIRPFMGGLTILSSDPELLQGEHRDLSIQLFLKDPYFFNFTELEREFKPNTRVFIFAMPTEFLSVSSLHKEEYVSIEDSAAILNQSSMQELLARTAKEDITIVDNHKNEFSALEYFSTIQEIGESLVSVKDEIRDEKYYKNTNAMAKNPFGVISLNLDHLYNNFKENKSSKSFKIQFKSRKTFWKYIISDKLFDKFSRLTVVDTQDKDFLFKEVDFKIDNDKKVRSFVSEKAIPYRINSKSRFQLIEKSNDENQVGKVVFKQLPEAKPEQFYQVLTDPNFTYSHIFI